MSRANVFCSFSAIREQTQARSRILRSNPDSKEVADRRLIKHTAFLLGRRRTKISFVHCVFQWRRSRHINVITPAIFRALTWTDGTNWANANAPRHGNVKVLPLNRSRKNPWRSPKIDAIYLAKSHGIAQNQLVALWISFANVLAETTVSVIH